MERHRRFLPAMMAASFSLIALVLELSLAGGETETADTPSATEESAEQPDPNIKKVIKTDEEWKRLLTAEQFRVTREAGTERPFGEAYKEFEAQGEGTYSCVCCGAELFTSNEKFHSGCGWPSFYDPAKAKNVATKEDRTHGMVRVEVVCAVCDAHLGHVFTGEGYSTPTDKRYCINAAALKFTPGKAAEEQGEKQDKAEPNE